jgi:hypothetical protein
MASAIWRRRTEIYQPSFTLTGYRHRWLTAVKPRCNVVAVEYLAERIGLDAVQHYIIQICGTCCFYVIIFIVLVGSNKDDGSFCQRIETLRGRDRLLAQYMSAIGPVDSIR